jgi:hypothetical protein
MFLQVDEAKERPGPFVQGLKKLHGKGATEPHHYSFCKLKTSSAPGYS